MIELSKKILETLYNSNLDWHGYYWWFSKDEFFKNYTWQEIELAALELVKLNLIDTIYDDRLRCLLFRRRRTFFEKILLK